MHIVPQSPYLWHSPFLALPAPKIAGLLMPPKPPVLSYSSAALNSLSLAQQAKLQDAMTALLDSAVAALGSPTSGFDAQAVSRTFWDRLGVPFGRFDVARLAATFAGWQTKEEMDAELDAVAERGLSELRERMADSGARAQARYGTRRKDGDA